MAELAQSQQTPATGQVVPLGTGPYPQHRPSQPGPMPMLMTGTGTPTPMPMPTPMPFAPVSERTGRTGMTAGVELSASPPLPSSNRLWFLIPAFCMIGLTGIIVGTIALRHRHTTPPPIAASAAPPPATTEEPVVTPVDPAAAVSLDLPATPPATSSVATSTDAPSFAPHPAAHPKKSPKKPPGPKPSGTAQGSGDFDHR